MLNIMSSALPNDFCQHLQQISSQEHYQQVLNSFNQAKIPCFRINPLRVDPDKLLAQLTEAGFNSKPLAGWDNAYTLEPHQQDDLTRSHFFNEGLIYLQNPASQLATQLLSPSSGEEILDLCAAPGSKTSQLAALMANQGRIAAVEAVKPRFFHLKANLKQQGVTIAQCYLKDGRRVGKACPARFDRVLLDAPCSSESRFTTLDEKSWQYWSLKKVKQCASKQKQLLYSAWQALKPGGTLIYSTCTFNLAENEQVIEHFQQHQSLTQAPILSCYQPAKDDNLITKLLNFCQQPQSIHLMRIWPDELFHGFFIAHIKKPATD